MKSIAVSALIGLSAGALGAAGFLYFRGGADDAKALKTDATAVLTQRLDEVEKTLAAQKAKDSEQDRRLRKVEEDRARQAAAPVENPAAIAAEKPAAAPAKETAEMPAAKSLRDWQAEIKAAKGDRSKYDQIWKDIRDQKLLDQLVALYEQAAKDDPQNPEAEVDLGNAYLQKIFEVGNGPLAGAWAQKADQAFDQALTIDPEHWEARFTKAVSLSFWPAFTGKQTEAVRNFETLIDQQEKHAPEAHFASTYVILGNLYEQQGKADKAQEIWKRGQTAFPDNAEIKKKIEGANRR